MDLSVVLCWSVSIIFAYVVALNIVAVVAQEREFVKRKNNLDCFISKKVRITAHFLYEFGII